MGRPTQQDIFSGVVVFLVALPLCLGIALASGAPLFAGLIAGIIGGIVVGAISNSQLGVSGPAAGLAVIVLTAIESLGGYQTFLAAVVVAGLIQLVLGLLKAGIIGHFFPTSVIKGMLSGIGVIIVLKEIPHAVGYDKDYMGDLSFDQPDSENTFSEFLVMLDYITPGAVAVSIGALLLIILWDQVLVKRFSVLKIAPGALVAVIGGIIFTNAVNPDSLFAITKEHLVSVPVTDDPKAFFSFFTLPKIADFAKMEVWTTGILMAVIASLETLLSVEAIDKLDPKKRVTGKNLELLAQGTGNIVSGLIGGLPITQVIVRSSANVQSGGDSKRSTIIHGFLLLICIILIPVLLNMIPLAVLASVLFIVGYKLAKPSLFKQMYKAGWEQFVPFIVTIAGVVFTDLLKGILMGLAVAIFIILRNSYRNSHFLHMEEAGNGEKKIKMTLAEEVTFLNKGAVRHALDSLPSGSSLSIDMSKSFRIDPDVMEIINDFRETSAERDISVELISSAKP
ncbi:MAG: SulP family inorganic anion transporter [Flavobacteriales bacterium]|nr:SulP family inorganic anion transporter [Flavobacteriales bacterium]